MQIEEMRKLIVAVCFTVSSSIFWGALAAAGVRYAFGLSPGTAVLYVGVPVALAFSFFMFPRLRKIIAS